MDGHLLPRRSELLEVRTHAAAFMPAIDDSLSRRRPQHVCGLRLDVVNVGERVYTFE
jgi:hypothetical protein